MSEINHDLEKTQCNVVISRSLLRKSKELAARREVSFSCFIRQLIQKELEKDLLIQPVEYQFRALKTG